MKKDMLMLHFNTEVKCLKILNLVNFIQCTKQYVPFPIETQNAS